MVKQFKIFSKILSFNAERYLRTAGDLFIYQGDYESALVMVEKTLEIQPGDTRALVLRGDILFCLNRDMEALQTFNQVLKLDERCVEAHISRAGVLDVLGRQREALESCNRAFELIQKHHDYLLPSLFDQKLALLVRLKKYREANRLLQDALNRLNADEYGYLATSYFPIIERYCRNRTQTKERAERLSLRVVSQ